MDFSEQRSLVLIKRAQERDGTLQKAERQIESACLTNHKIYKTPQPLQWMLELETKSR